ncbi:Protein argonaute 4 -like protein [Gossypium arboreum]|uniref:Protein argonaute 4-like protein n=1 Tax=Gossypium arboreum TaxID=29729 RepID=A0A0B0MHU0_GOSAR|nr:Protein argonaute 4 -like protein [Gossypium arboreum]
MGALFSFPEQSDVPSIAVMILSSKPVSNKVDDDIMKEALVEFYTSSGKRKPDQIIIFRDGGSPDNVLHGTIIDNKVCHPKNNNFYLGTHAGMIGITRQTHYHVLLDQAGFLADDLEEFVHSLSYMYQRRPQSYLLWLLFATLIWQLHSWGQFMKIRDVSKISSSYGRMYAPRVIFVPQLSSLKDKVSNFILIC